MSKPLVFEEMLVDPPAGFGAPRWWRTPIPGGWLIADMARGTIFTFVPDPGHTWDGGSIPAVHPHKER